MLKTGTITKEEKNRRLEHETKLKSSYAIKDNPPSYLDSKGRKYYKAIIKSMPEGVLCDTDSFTVAIVADALGRMQACSEILNSDGLLVEYTNKAGATNIDAHKAVGIYQKYSQIFNTFGSKLGLSPADRSRLALLASNEDESENMLFKALRGEQI
ncbi:phage terminase small subunit P27 family [Clostridium butyricum]|uniref:phage terminase small subunit P27 family n=1 Tax=Clostridium butyricum TaxID=1492 RepID=UPI002AB0D960|nr:phage terminase small subunit P27 family [Clostridium butyricum]